MTTGRPFLRLALGAALALPALAASAAAPLSEDEMSGVHGQGLSAPVLVALGASDASGASASATAADLAAALDGAAAGSAQEMDRQLARQRLQAAATGMQTTLRLAQAMGALSTSTASIVGLAALPMLGLPFAFSPLAGLQQPPTGH